MKRILDTERLILREFDSSDTEKMYRLNSDPEVLLYSGDSPFASIEKAKEFLENYSDYKKNGYGRWAVILKSSDEFIGWCGLKYNEEKCVDIGFRYFRKIWNKGYATEAARATLDYGFNIFKLEDLRYYLKSDFEKADGILKKEDLKCIIYVDPAFSSSKTSDDAVVM